MDLQNQIPEEPEEAPAEIKFIELRPEPWPEDHRRIRIHVQITPFEQRPNLDLVIMDASGEEVATVTIVEIFDPKFVITMHLRGEQTTGKFNLTGKLYYEESETLDQANTPFEIP